MPTRVLFLWLVYWAALCGFAAPINHALRYFPGIVQTDVTPLLFMGALLFWALICGLPAQAAVHDTPSVKLRASAFGRFLRLQGEWLAVLLLSLTLGLAIAARLGSFAPEQVIRCMSALVALTAFLRALAALSGRAYFFLLTLFCAAPPLCRWLANQSELARTGHPLADETLAQLAPLRLLLDPQWSLPQMIALAALTLMSLLAPLLQPTPFQQPRA